MGVRNVRVDGIELIRRLHVAVRDVNWGTAPATTHAQHVAEAGDALTVSFSATHLDERAGIDFEWTGVLDASPEGVLTFSIDGRARRPFAFARIGICILHPAEFAGATYRALTSDGWVDGVLDTDISPQRPGVLGLGEPLFPAFSALELVRPDGLGVYLELDGDLFEFEDQRNWTDASFKTYSTPLHLGCSHRAEVGHRVLQSVRISPVGSTTSTRRIGTSSSSHVVVEIGDISEFSLPSIGLCVPADGPALSPRDAGLARALRPAHLRFDLRLATDEPAEAIKRALAYSRLLAAPLELAITLADDDSAIDGLQQALETRVVPIARVLVFRDTDAVTSSADLRFVRERIAAAVGDAPFFGGTDLLFADLNADRPELGGADGIAYPLVPTMHADDDLSLIETIAVHGETVRTARTFCAALPIAVTPITIRQRQTSGGGLPIDADVRQASLLGAVWTFGTASSMSRAGAASLTYYELVGGRGVLGADAAPSGDVFPLYHAIADLSEWRGGRLLHVQSSRPHRLAALGVRDRVGDFHLLVANLYPEPVTCQIACLPAGKVRIRRLDESNCGRACSDPTAYRAEAETVDAPTEMDLELGPYALVRMDGVT